MTSVATVTVALFLSGVVTGVIVVVALAIRREDRRYSLVRRHRTGCRAARAGSPAWAAEAWTPILPGQARTGALARSRR